MATMISGIVELHFYVTGKGLLCEVLLSTTMDNFKSEVWKHKMFPDGSAISVPMKELHLALNWKTGKKSEQYGEKESESEGYGSSLDD